MRATFWCKNALAVSGWAMVALLCQCTSPPVVETVEVPQPTTTAPVELADLSPLAQVVLGAQQRSHTVVLNWATLGKGVQLDAPSSQAQRQLEAVLGGRQRLLQPHYRRIYDVSQRPARHLDLSFQELYYLPDRICRRPDLRYLNLSNNQLQVINPLLAQCRQLRKLDLTSNGFQHLPEGLLELDQLQELVLIDNLLQGLPQRFARLQGLRVLELGNLHASASNHFNAIHRLPPVLLQMPQLQKLFLDKLPLRQLPRSLPNMRGLRVLSLNGNRAMQWHGAFQTLGQMPQLLALDISFIGHQRLPESIRELRHLKILIWHEEGQRNQAFIENTLRQWLPNTKIYYGKKGVATPFLRGNTITTIEKIARE